MGRDLWNNTYYPTKGDVANVTKPSYIINAEGQVRPGAVPPRARGAVD